MKESNLDLGGLEDALSRLYEARSRVGCIPQGPATLRARAGAALIRSIRRGLAWLLPQLDGFHAATIQSSEEQLSLISQLVSCQTELEEEIRRLRSGNSSPAASPAVPKEPDPEDNLSPEGWLESIRQQAALSALQKQECVRGPAQQ
jgi:hypothetical protein